MILIFNLESYSLPTWWLVGLSVENTVKCHSWLNGFPLPEWSFFLQHLGHATLVPDVKEYVQSVPLNFTLKTQMNKIRIKSMEHFKTKWFNYWITYSWWCITVVLSSRTYLPHTSQPCDSSRPDHVGCTAGINYRHWESETFSSSIKTSHNYEYYLIILMLLMYYASVCVYATNQSLV